MNASHFPHLYYKAPRRSYADMKREHIEITNAERFDKAYFSENQKIAETNSPYSDFLVFEEDVFEGEAKQAFDRAEQLANQNSQKVKGKTIDLRRLSYKSTDIFAWNKQANVSADGMQKIAGLIESGQLPPHVTILFYSSSFENQDFMEIARALKSGKCPANLKIKFFFDLENAIETTKKTAKEYTYMNVAAYCGLSEHWVKPLIDAYESGRCPAGLEIEFCYPLSDKLNKDLENGKNTYHKLLAQQQAVVLAQGRKNGSLSAKVFDDIVIDLISYYLIHPYLIQPAMPIAQFSFLHAYEAKFLLIAVESFISKYSDSKTYIQKAKETVLGNDSIIELFDNTAANILKGKGSVITKAALIKEASLLFLHESLGDLAPGQYRKEKNVQLLGQECGLFKGYLREKVKINKETKEVKEKTGEFKLSPAFFSAWEKHNQGGLIELPDATMPEQSIDHGLASSKGNK
jgi:hypothetical protein